MLKQKKKMLLKGVIKATIGVSLIIFLVYKFYNKKVERLDYSFNNFYLFIGLSFILLSFLVVVLRIHTLICKYVKNFTETFRVFLIGWFFSNVLPTNVGGDGYMIIYLKKKASSMTEAITLITFQRFVSLMVIILYGIGYLMFYPNWINKMSLNVNLNFGNKILILLIFLTVFLGFSFIFRKKTGILFYKTLKFLINYKNILKEIDFKKHIELILLSILYQLLRLGGFYFFLLSFNQKVNILALLFIMFVVTVGSLIPISIGALGVQETLFTLGLSTLGVAVPIAIIVSFINRGIFILVALIGGFFFLVNKNTNQKYSEINKHVY